MINPLLEAREERWRKRLRKAAALPPGSSLVTLTLRMPAPLRLREEWGQRARQIHRALLDSFEERGFPPGQEEFRLGADGPEGYLVVSAGAAEVKKAAIAFEQHHPLGPLADGDVMDPSGQTVGREDLSLPPRTCLLCGHRGAECTRERIHPPEEIEKRVEFLWKGWEGAEKPFSFREESSARIARCADTALHFEAAACPKPGLVDPLTRGAHGDMDYFTFLRSGSSLAPWWGVFARSGWNFRGDDPALLLPPLRDEGRRAEAAMFKATEGINTHKGLIFSLGILCAASGMLERRGAPFSPRECCTAAAGIVRGVGEADFAAARRKERGSLTAGERLFVDFGVTGIRGEAEKGFPSVTDHALPRLRGDLEEGVTMNDAMVNALLVLFTVSEDTNVLARCGTDGAALLKKKGAEPLAAGGMKTPDGRAAVHALDGLFTESRLSPGGCADLLAVTVFLHLLCPEDTAPEIPY